MKLTNHTVTVLKNMASLNKNIVISPGSNLVTKSKERDVFAKAEVDVSFDKRFAIHDLNQFLGIYALLDDPRLVFENDYVTISDGSGRSRVKYYYADERTMKDQLTADIIGTLEDPVVDFDLDIETFRKIRQTATVLGHDKLCVSNGNGTVKLSVIDITYKTSNNFQIDVPGNASLEEYVYIMDISRLKFIEGDYKVSFSAGGRVAHFVNKSMPVQYWVGLTNPKKMECDL